MPTTLQLTEDLVQRLAPDTDSVQNARGLVRKNSFTSPGVSADGTWLLAQCKGSGKTPYEVSIDLADPQQPTCRCSCPSRKFPCKHGLGLLLLYMQASDKFTAHEPPPELLAKRDKKAEREQKKTEAGPPAPRKVNKEALVKKAAAQRDGLHLLEKLLVDLVAAGQWFEKSHLDKLDRQAKQLGDAYLPAAMYVLNRLILVGRDPALPEDKRHAQAADLVGQLWATVQKGRSYLDDKLTGDESQADADAVVEEILGKVWQLAELREKGYVKTDLSLLELAFERGDDHARQQRVETSHLVELRDGALYQAIAYRPFKGLSQIPEQPSYPQPLAIAEAAVYPGFIDRRVRWEKGTEKVEELKPAHLQAAYGVARAEFKPAIDALRQQMKHPLAPREAVVLLRCERLGRVGDCVVLEDGKGHRIEAVDRRKDYSNLANLVRVGGMIGAERPAVLVRLFVRPLGSHIVAEPLAALTPQVHLRLGL